MRSHVATAATQLRTDAASEITAAAKSQLLEQARELHETVAETVEPNERATEESQLFRQAGLSEVGSVPLLEAPEGWDVEVDGLETKKEYPDGQQQNKSGTEVVSVDLSLSEA